jgi:hypothetical protein
MMRKADPVCGSIGLSAYATGSRNDLLFQVGRIVLRGDRRHQARLLCRSRVRGEVRSGVIGPAALAATAGPTAIVPLGRSDIAGLDCPRDG